MAAEEQQDELVYAPDMVPHEEGDKLYCFIAAERVCGPDCMAFTTVPAEMKSSTLDDNQRHCSLLVNVERLGRHSVILTSLFAHTTGSLPIAQHARCSLFRGLFYPIR